MPCVIIRHLSDSGVFEPLILQFFNWQEVVTPFSDYRAIFQQQQSRIASNDGLESRLVSVTECIVCRSGLFPNGYSILITCREAVERVAIIVCIVGNHVDISEISIVRILQMR